jgi:hypothetical protein
LGLLNPQKNEKKNKEKKKKKNGKRREMVKGIEEITCSSYFPSLLI